MNVGEWGASCGVGMGQEKIRYDLMVPVGNERKFYLRGRFYLDFGKCGCLVSIYVLRRGEIVTRHRQFVDSSVDEGVN